MINYKKHPEPKKQLAEILAGKATNPPAPEPYRGPVRLILPMPPEEVWPNARPHRFALSKARRLQKTDTVLACRSQQVPRAMLQKATAAVTFFFRTNRGRDKDNAAAALKATWDGLAKYGLLANDKGLTPMAPTLEVDPKNPRVEIVITKD